ncbi:MAG: serine/threonine protein kinase [Deltaproteobacteria bacterium]|nr:MAG: serine/threonine protein kinase [Deltaproteobacteria bacterium]
MSVRFHDMEGVPAIGSVLMGKYIVEDLLGYGGMGSVVRVSHIQSGEILALKTMLPGLAVDAELRARFLREGQSAERLRGEHVARVLDVGILPSNSPYIAMEYLQGQDLADQLRRRMLRPGEAVDYILQACVGLAEAHANGIVHRDIKPSNQVLDFGISKTPALSCELASTRSDLVMGTPAYMSPEQMKGAKGVDARADIWSLGIVLYECLMGFRPFEADSFSAFVLKVSNEPPRAIPSRIPHGLQSIVMRCLAKDREDRFPTVIALANKLAAFAENGHAAKLSVARAQIMMRRGVAPQPTMFVAVEPTHTTLRVRATALRSTRQRARSVIASNYLLALLVLGTCSIAMVITGVMMIYGRW